MKHEKSKHALLISNACAHKCKLVQDFLETETVVQLHHQSYSPDLGSCDRFLFTLLIVNFSRRQY